MEPALTPSPRSAASEIAWYGLTSWDFRVKANGGIGWKLLQQMAKMQRAARAELPSRSTSSCARSAHRRPDLWEKPEAPEATRG